MDTKLADVWLRVKRSVLKRSLLARRLLLLRKLSYIFSQSASVFESVQFLHRESSWHNKYIQLICFLFSIFISQKWVLLCFSVLFYFPEDIFRKCPSSPPQQEALHRRVLIGLGGLGRRQREGFILNFAFVFFTLFVFISTLLGLDFKLAVSHYQGWYVTFILSNILASWTKT